MKTIKPSTKETVRGFKILVCMVEGKSILNSKKNEVFFYDRFDDPGSCYPFFSGEEALKMMTKINERGLESLAYTEGHEGKESLNLKEMQEIYS